jgi:hypothetical protein
MSGMELVGLFVLLIASGLKILKPVPVKDTKYIVYEMVNVELPLLL